MSLVFYSMLSAFCEVDLTWLRLSTVRSAGYRASVRCALIVFAKLYALLASFCNVQLPRESVARLTVAAAQNF